MLLASLLHAAHVLLASLLHAAHVLPSSLLHAAHVLPSTACCRRLVCRAQQSALPAILTPAADSDAARELTRFKADVLAQLEDHAQFTVEALSGLEGLTVVVPQGAMYVMVRVDVDLLADVADDVEFCSKLLAEESVVALPGQCFGVRNFVRVVFTAPKDKLEVAYARIRDFCARHRKSGAP